MNNHNDTPTQNTQVELLSGDYREGRLNRRDFLARLALVTGSMAAAHLLVEQNGLAQVISQREVADAANGTIQINGADVDFSQGELKLGGYLASPQGKGPFPAVVVIHENRGLNEHAGRGPTFCN